MKYDKVINYFVVEKGLNDLINDIKPIFDLIDDYTQQILQNVMVTIPEFEKAKSQLVGCVMELNPVLSAAMTAKRNGELHFYVNKKREIENRPATIDDKGKSVKEKFVDGATQTESEESVADYRRVRNIVQGYINSAWAGIKDSEDRIINLKTEHKNG